MRVSCAAVPPAGRAAVPAPCLNGGVGMGEIGLASGRLRALASRYGVGM